MPRTCSNSEFDDGGSAAALRHVQNQKAHALMHGNSPRLQCHCVCRCMSPLKKVRSLCGLGPDDRVAWRRNRFVLPSWTGIAFAQAWRGRVGQSRGGVGCSAAAVEVRVSIAGQAEWLRHDSDGVVLGRHSTGQTLTTVLYNFHITKKKKSSPQLHS